MDDIANEKVELKAVDTPKKVNSKFKFQVKGKKVHYMGIAIGIVLLIATVLLLSNVLNLDGGRVTTISSSSLKKVVEINDLSTLDYTYNAITEVYDENGTRLKYYVAYEGTVTAGVDISQIDISVNEEEKLITVVLPDAEVQHVNVHMGTLEFIFIKDKYETETVSQEAYKVSLDDLKKKANEEETLLSMAKDNAVAAINALIAPWVKQIDETYTVEIK